MKFSFNMLWQRSSKPKLGSCLSVCNIPKPKTEQTNKYPEDYRCGCAIITHSTGEGTDGRRSVRERLHLLRSQTCHKGSQKKEVHVLHVTLKHITSVCKGSRSSHRTKCCSQKEIRRELQSHPKTIHIPSGRWPPDHPSVTGGGRVMSIDPTQVHVS